MKNTKNIQIVRGTNLYSCNTNKFQIYYSDLFKCINAEVLMVSDRHLA